MKLLISTLIGLEDLTIQEIVEITNKKPEIQCPGLLVLDKVTKNQYYTIAYYSRSIINVTVLINNFEFETLDNIIENIRNFNFKEYLNDDFSVSCIRKGNHNFNSKPILDTTVKIISNKYNINVNYKNPSVIITINIFENKCFISVDLIGIQLNKRLYKVKTSRSDINSCLAFAALRFTDYDTTKSLLDPFCGNSSIVIEAALYAKKIPNLYKKENLKIPKNIINKLDKEIENKTKLKIYGFDPIYFNIKRSRINAKVAEVYESIEYQNYDLDWLDTKFSQNELDIIISNLPIASQRNYKDTLALYSKFFHQANFVLNKKGCIIVISTKSDDFIGISENNNFKLVNCKKVYSGKLEYSLLKFTKIRV